MKDDFHRIRKKILLTSEKIKKDNKSHYYYEMKLFCIILIIIIYILIGKLNEVLYLNKLQKVLKNEEDIELFLSNKTEYYFQKRKNYLKHFNYLYDESKLITLQDKNNYLLIHECPEYKTNYVDKIKIHDVSKKILGKDICPPILKIYNNIKDINLDDLPDKFVLKCNHGSGMNIICKNKLKFNFEEAKNKLTKWMNINYGTSRTEFQYNFIERKIFLAPYLGDKIIDYEIYCFNGQPKFVRVRKLIDEQKHITLHNYYDLDWKLNDIDSGLFNYKRDPNMKIEKPKHFDLMIYYSKKLSKDFVFVRIDFYEINNIVYLSEITFSPSNTLNRYKNKEQSKYLGDMLDITKIKSSLFNK